MRIRDVLVGVMAMGFVAGGICEVRGQRQFISSTEYVNGTSSKYGLINNKSRQVINTTETLEDGAVVKTVEDITEVLKPDRSRYYVKITDHGQVTETETINISYMRYTRKDGGAWTAHDTRHEGSGTGSGNGTGVGGPRCDQYTVETSSYNGMPMQLFSWLSVEGSGKELTFFEGKRWIDSDGLLHRAETTLGRLSPRVETMRNVTTYEYDPNIKIEAPIK